MSDALLEELLDKPVGPRLPQRVSAPEDFTAELEVSSSSAVATLRGDEGSVTEGTAAEFLRQEGQDPSEWEVVRFRKSQWGDGQESVRFEYRRTSQAAPEVDVEEALEALKSHVGPAFGRETQGDHGALVLIGDMQFGKIDGDGVTGTLKRTIACIDAAAEQIEMYRRIYDIGHVHVAWLGDHIEGFVSQGGANAWRTQLTLNEQIRLTRRVMLYALSVFGNSAERVSMAAVPGNHGEPQRFEGTGQTRYDDSHDTEALIAVSDAAGLLNKYEHVRFYVPDTDELIVSIDVAGTQVAHHHGHRWRPDKHFEWWSNQAFNRNSPMHMANLLVAGHLHHEHIDTSGDRTFIGVPAMESESTWFRHSRGVGGAPGLMLAITKDGQTPVKHAISAKGVSK